MKTFLALMILVSSVSVFAQEQKLCAIVHNSHNYYERATLAIHAGESISNLNEIPMGRSDWDNKITVVKMQKDCTLIGYQHQDFNINYYTGRTTHGFSVALTNQSHAQSKRINLNSYYDNMISSLQCFCK